jgi:hypothetical protein
MSQSSQRNDHLVVPLLGAVLLGLGLGLGLRLVDGLPDLLRDEDLLVLRLGLGLGLGLGLVDGLVLVLVLRLGVGLSLGDVLGLVDGLEFGFGDSLFLAVEFLLLVGDGSGESRSGEDSNKGKRELHFCGGLGGLGR